MIVNYLRSVLPYKTLVILVSLFSFMTTTAFSMSSDEEENVSKKTVSKKKKTTSKKKKTKQKESEPKKLDAIAQVLNNPQAPELLAHISRFTDIGTLASMRLTSRLWRNASYLFWTVYLAEHNDLEAQANLAQIYKEGSNTVQKSEEKASYWYERVAESPYPSKGQRKEMFILAVDGGGIRGLLPARVIQYWEERLAEEFGFEVHMADFVEVVAGTSTGSIIVLGLAVPTEFDKYRAKYQASKLAEIYEQEGLTIFPQPKYRVGRWAKSTKQFLSKSKFSATPLENTLERYFQSVRLSQATQNINVLVPAYSLSGNKPVWFDGSKAKESSEEDPMMCVVARCSAAAPTYLCAGKFNGQRLVDGGILKNDPSHKAYLKFGLKSNKKVIVISLGTGEENKELPVKTLKKGGDVQWAKHIAPIMMTGIAKETEDDMRLLDEAGVLKYYRIQSILEKAVLDDASEKSINALNEAAKTLIEGNPQVKEVYQELVQICLRQSRVLEHKLELISLFPILNFSNLKIVGNRYFSIFNENLRCATQLAHLHLRRCGLTADHVEVFCESLKANTALVYLDLSENGIGPTGVDYLGRLLKKHKSLTELDLHCNGIGKGDPKATLSLFKRKKGMPTFLISLNLSDNDISSEHFSPILEVLTVVKDVSPLRKLTLLENNIQLSKKDKKSVMGLKKKQISIVLDK